MTNDQAILGVIGSAIALVRSEDALDRRWTPERAAVVEDRTRTLRHEVSCLCGGLDARATVVTALLVLARSILREIDSATLTATCEEIAGMLD